ncbi:MULTISPECIES: SGNH/GDSL hydrolase family protein [unclassified Paraburkholderia]|uniref:SGNH/GDSL hydrolase family protein n=1 Tax=unclassified Paraburkholderia TaxID=2615204 RepID=UPI002AB15361|nr:MULTISPECIES: SGNH/GDSL hydrolase family protein [unclassified Paraburkholderia]MBN3854971.1 SGNH/GDSL hydrolase family protein [Paraburkholderia sp. Ac-20340]
MAAAASVLLGLSVLVIGESHLTLNNHLREPLVQSLQAQGAAHVHVVGVCGASPGRWLKSTPGDCGADQVDQRPATVLGKEAHTTPIADLIHADKPNLVVVIEGDTMGSYDKPAFPKAWAWQEVTGLTKAIADTHTACVWVGPGWGSNSGQFAKSDDRVRELSAFLANNVAPCSYIDSTTFAKPGQWQTLDGEHYTQMGYVAWSKAIANAMQHAPAVQGLKKP